jgi:hypothetical protein
MTELSRRKQLAGIFRNVIHEWDRYSLLEGGAPKDEIEALTNSQIIEDLNRFKTELRRTVASFFTDPASLDGSLSRDIPKAIVRTDNEFAP